MFVVFCFKFFVVGGGGDAVERKLEGEAAGARVEINFKKIEEREERERFEYCTLYIENKRDPLG